MKLDTRTAPAENSVYLFSGLLKCADCGQNMIRRTTTKKGKKYFYYHCSTYKNGDGCSSHLISEVKLKQTVLEVVQNQIRLLIEADQILNQIDSMPQEQLGIKTLNAQMATLSQEIERYKDLKTKVYQDMLDGIVSREEFKDINARFTEKLHIAQAAHEENEKKRDKILSRESNLRPWMEQFKKYQNIECLERKMMVAIIEQITVYGKEHVEIRFRYADEMQEMFEWAAEQEEEKLYEGRKVAIG
jgi:ssDNA-binding Zn-finger/Zn-ribbon topoisomerase 1